MRKFAANSVHLAILFVGLSGASEPPLEIDPPVPGRVTAERFHRALEQKMNGSWRRVSLRSVTTSIAREREISILLDRRIDPSREQAWDFRGRTLRNELVDLAERNNSGVSVVANTVYFGPPSSASKLRTLVRIREDEIIDRAAKLPEGRDLEILRDSSMHWGDLANPADLVRRIASKYHLEVAGIELVSHDLWAAGSIPSASAAESLLLVLIQFDLAFEWTADAAGIRIVPAPDRPAVEKSYQAPKPLSSEILEAWGKEHPFSQIRKSEKGYSLVGTVEDQESFSLLLRPNGIGLPAGNRTAKPAPLSRQTFTLKVERVSFRSLLEELEKRGVEFDFDEKGLAAAGIDLNTRVDLDVQKAGPDEFFDAMCRPLGLGFRIAGNKVTLFPKSE
ncbi:MAG: hypothetical protein AB7O26_08345 [Planctomycetaceae bacterium]